MSWVGDVLKSLGYGPPPWQICFLIPFGSRIRRGDILIKNMFGSQGERRDFKIILSFYL